MQTQLAPFRKGFWLRDPQPVYSLSAAGTSRDPVGGMALAPIGPGRSGHGPLRRRHVAGFAFCPVLRGCGTVGMFGAAGFELETLVRRPVGGEPHPRDTAL